MIQLGLYGLGRWGRNLVQSVQATSDKLRFTASATRTPENARAFCEGHEIELCADYAQLLSRDDITGVVLATPNSQHFAQIMAAVEAGKHVFCEKPFTLRRDHTEQALTALKKAGLIAGTGYNRRCSPNMIALKEMMDTGALGDPVHIEGHFSNNMAMHPNNWRANRKESPAGGMASLGTHVADAFIHLFGRVKALDAHSSRVAMPYAVDDSTRVLFEFCGGQTGYLGTVASSAPLWQIRVFGTNGWAELREQSRLEVMRDDRSSIIRHWEGYDYPSLKTIAAILEAFAESISNDRTFPVTPDEILHGADIFDAVINGAKSGKKQVLKQR